MKLLILLTLSFNLFAFDQSHTAWNNVLKEFYNVFWIILLMQPLCALAFIFDGVFKGLGKMKYLRNVLLFSTFAVFIPIIKWTDNSDYKFWQSHFYEVGWTWKTRMDRQASKFYFKYGISFLWNKSRCC